LFLWESLRSRNLFNPVCAVCAVCAICAQAQLLISRLNRDAVRGPHGRIILPFNAYMPSIKDRNRHLLFVNTWMNPRSRFY
jgi:hypothetical protein